MRFFSFICLMCFIALPVMAQDTASKIPEKPRSILDEGLSLEELSNRTPHETFARKKTDNISVAMLFHKLIGKTPNLKSWAEQSRSWRNADETEKPAVRKSIVERLETKFSLMSRTEPIYVEKHVTLRQFKVEENGFFIDGFKKSTFFDYTFGGERYALVPVDLMDQEYIKVTPEKMALIADHITNKNQLYMRLSLVPFQADGKRKTTLGQGDDYWLMAGRVADIEFYSLRDKRLLWRSNQDRLKKKNVLLDLYQ